MSALSNLNPNPKLLNLIPNPNDKPQPNLNPEPNTKPQHNPNFNTWWLEKPRTKLGWSHLNVLTS